MKKLFKKAMITMCSAVMLMGISAVGANAATVEVGDFTVEKSGYGSSLKVSIAKYTGTDGKITLPTTAKFGETEYAITSVGAAFTANEIITDVVIPEGYDTVSLSAFANCPNLKGVSIPGTMSMIAASAFKDCPKLETVTFAGSDESSLRFRNDVFAGCTSLTSIELPKQLSSVDNNFLRGCTSLTSISVADGSENFAADGNILYDVSGEGAVMTAYPFGKQETEFTIPGSVNGKTVTEIGPQLFKENGTLKKITVPQTVTGIARYAFNGMKAIEEIILEHETAPSLGSEVCTEMKAGSKVIVKNEDVAKAFESTLSYTKYYTSENTTITVAGSEPEEKTVSAAVSIEADKITDGKAVYNIYLDSAENVNTVLLKVSFDSSKVAKGEIVSTNDKFIGGTSVWSEENGKLVLKAYLGITGNVTGFSSANKTKLAEISVPLKVGAKGNITADISDFKAAGIVSEEESAMNGTVTITAPSTSIFVPSYDVNGDSTVDIIDITEAQRYYQATSSDTNWETAKAMDVNGDNKVDIEDYIAIFNNLSDF